MTSSNRYVVITPVRNEAGHFARTIESFASQTIRPVAWIIVDDGSTDGTAALADMAAADHSWIQVIHRADRGFRKPAFGVMESFFDAFDRGVHEPWDYLAKIDGDLSFEPEYFEACFTKFDENPRLGIGGGALGRQSEGRWVEECKGDPAFHVRGGTKIYRRACWDQIGGLIRAPGWDTVDEVKANFLGWETRTFGDIWMQVLKGTGSADGNWRNWTKNGLANYITGYHPLFMFVKCVRRFFRRPYGIAGIALAWGFLRGYFNGTPRVEDKGMIRYLHEQQLRKLTLQPSIWG